MKSTSVKIFFFTSVILSSIFFTSYLSYHIGIESGINAIKSINTIDSHQQLENFFLKTGQQDFLNSALQVGLIIGRDPSPENCFAGWEFFRNIRRVDISNRLATDKFNCSFTGENKVRFDKLKSIPLPPPKE